MKKYRPGTLIAPQSKKSPINFAFIDFYDQKIIYKSEDISGEAINEDSEGNTMFKRALNKLSKKNNFTDAIREQKEIKFHPSGKGKASWINMFDKKTKEESCNGGFEYEDTKITYNHEPLGVSIIIKGVCEVK